MTDPDLIAKKLAFIEACVSELRRHSRPELIEKDVKEERFIAHTLQIAIQAALDVASHIVSDERRTPFHLVLWTSEPPQYAKTRRSLQAMVVPLTKDCNAVLVYWGSSLRAIREAAICVVALP